MTDLTLTPEAIAALLAELDGVRLGVRERRDMQAVIDAMSLIEDLAAERDALRAEVARLKGQPHD